MRRLAHPARLRNLPPSLSAPRLTPTASASSPAGAAGGRQDQGLHTSSPSYGLKPYPFPSVKTRPPQPKKSDTPSPSPHTYDLRRLPVSALGGSRIARSASEGPVGLPVGLEDLEPPSSALAALLSRLGLDASDERLRGEVVKCLTHPSWVDRQKRRESLVMAGQEAPRVTGGQTAVVESGQGTSGSESTSDSDSAGSTHLQSTGTSSTPTSISTGTSTNTSSPAATHPSHLSDNALLSSLGSSLLALFASEHLAHTYPFLPTDLLSASVTAYVGSEPLSSVGRELGVSVHGGGNQVGAVGLGRGMESAGVGVRFDREVLSGRRGEEARRLAGTLDEQRKALETAAKRGNRGQREQDEDEDDDQEEGENVDTLLQEWDKRRSERKTAREEKALRAAVGKDGKRSRQTGETEEGETTRGGQGGKKGEVAFAEVVASTVRSVVGLVYQEKGIHFTRQFVHAHFLSRHLDLSALFRFKNPLFTLATVISRYLSDVGVPRDKRALLSRVEVRLLASTGAHSSTPLFNIGLFLPTGLKLAEGHGSSLAMAKHRAATNALLSFYLVRGDQGFALPGMSASASGSGSGSGSSSSSAAEQGSTVPGVQLPTSVHTDYVLPLSFNAGGIRRHLRHAAGMDGGMLPGDGMLAAWGREGNQDNSTRDGGRLRKIEQVEASGRY